MRPTTPRRIILMPGRYLGFIKPFYADENSIIKDYYLEAPKSGMRVPRIFGMTASPVDAKVDVVEAAEYAHSPPIFIILTCV